MCPPRLALEYTLTWSLMPGPEMPWFAHEESSSAIQLSHQWSSPDQLARCPLKSAFSQVQNSPLGQSAAPAGEAAAARAPHEQKDGGRGGGEGALHGHGVGKPFSVVFLWRCAEESSAARCSARVRSRV